MNRIKRGVTAHSKHKKVLKLAKGYYGARSRVFRVAKQAVIKASQYAFRDRKALKRDMRSLWIVRINGALSDYSINYSVFMHRLKTLKVELNRKMLAELALHNPGTFKSLVERTLTLDGTAVHE
jgi:large subunit ribosomal protein L20